MLNDFSDRITWEQKSYLKGLITKNVGINTYQQPPDRFADGDNIIIDVTRYRGRLVGHFKVFNTIQHTRFHAAFYSYETIAQGTFHENGHIHYIVSGRFHKIVQSLAVTEEGQQAYNRLMEHMKEVADVKKLKKELKMKVKNDDPEQK